MPKKKVEVCEACLKFEYQYTIQPKQGGYPPYKLCANCMTNLVMLSLAPHEFLNLIKNDPDRKWEFWLHDDFYDPNTGHAYQPLQAQ